MADKVRFGVYELDREALELRKHGVRLRLQDQPLQVLTALVERPGEVVTREQLQQRIWGNDTFVDFEQSLNKAVNRLREALNDDPAQPRYVETVPRRGYRFVAPVTGSVSTASQPATALPRADSELSKSGSHWSRSTRIAMLTIGSIAIIASLTALLWRSRKPHESNLPEVKHVTSSAFCCPTLSRDGKLLAYVEVEGVPHIWVRQTAGGEAIPVTKGPDADYFPNFSPDGTRVVYWSIRGGGGIYVTPTFGGEPKLIAKAVDSRVARFSPDGKKIIYWSGARAMIVPAEGGEQSQVNINHNFTCCGQVWWAPSGDRVLACGVVAHGSKEPERWWISSSLKSGETISVPLPEGEGFDCESVTDWVRDENGHEWIVYFETKGFTWTLFRLGISDQGRIVGEPEQINAGTGQMNYLGASVSVDGKVAYLTFREAWAIHEIPFFGGHGNQVRKQSPTVQLALPVGGDYRSPSVSRNGQWMAYTSSEPANPSRILLRDLGSGTDHLLDDRGHTGGVSIAPDGSKVAFGRNCKNDSGLGKGYCGFMIQAAGGDAEQVCEWCTARGFSSDGTFVLIQKLQPPRDHIALVDLSTREEKDFLVAADKPLYHAYFSWDDRWVAFKKVIASPRFGVTQIMIAPVRGHVAGEEADWIAVTDGHYQDDKPQFSPDGNTVYFTSTRDGYLCIWGQKLNPVTKYPAGPPFAFEHFHNSAGAAGANDQSTADLSVARDKMLINLPEVHTDIWLQQMR